MANMQFKEVLVCNVPTISLFIKSLYIEIPLGPSMLSNAIKKTGSRVEYFDLNLALNSSRFNPGKITDLERAVLLDSKKTLAFLKNPDEENNLYKWANSLISLIKARKYKYICLSLERRVYKTYVFVAGFNFSLILARLLKEKYGNVPIYLGGRKALAGIGEKYIKRYTNQNKVKICIDKFFKNALADDFIRLIDEDEKFKKRNRKSLILARPSKGNANKCAKAKKEGLIDLPEYNISNKKDLNSDIKKLFPDKFINNFPEIKKIKPFHVVPFKFIYGCPFNCAYCQSRFEDVSAYTPPPKKAVEAIRLLVEKYGVTNFRFYNCNINVNEKYVFEFCNEIKKQNLKIKFSDSGNLKIASQYLFSALKEAGCVKLWYGIETISPSLLKRLNRNFNHELYIKGLESSAKAGIFNAVNFIVGFPHENENDLNLLSEFIKKYNYLIDCWNCYGFVLFKNSDMYRYPERFGIKNIKKLNWEEYGLTAYSYQYDESDGLNWNQLQLIRRDRTERIRRELGPNDKNAIFKNDYLLFALSQLTSDREKIKNYLVEYFNLLKRKKNNLFSNKYDFQRFILSLDYDYRYDKFDGQFENQVR